MINFFVVEPDNRIKIYEDCIARLEECRREGTGDPSQIEREIENAYQQIALLKIRQSMDASL